MQYIADFWTAVIPAPGPGSVLLLALLVLTRRARVSMGDRGGER